MPKSPPAQMSLLTSFICQSWWTGPTGKAASALIAASYVIVRGLFRVVPREDPALGDGLEEAHGGVGVRRVVGSRAVSAQIASCSMAPSVSS